MHTKGDKTLNRIGHLILSIMTILALVPVILMFIASFTDDATILKHGYSFFPKKLSAYAYSWVLTSNGGTILRAYGISVLLTVVGVACALVLTTGLAYGLSKKNLPGKGVLTFLVFFTMLFNGGLVPTYINYTNVFHIKDTFFALLVPSLMMNAFNVFLMKSYFSSAVPEEILESAYLEGAGELQILLQVVIPLSKPIIATVGMFSGIAYWNDWNNGFIYLVKRTDLYSIQNLLNRLMQNIMMLQQNASQVGDMASGLAEIPAASVRMAMAALGILPLIIVYPFVQKNFVAGITLGGVKG